MPELPEVEYGRKIAERVACGRLIARVWCAGDALVFDETNPNDFGLALTGRRILAVRRWGKQLWFDLDEGPHPLFHFGMTGAFRVADEAPLKLASHGRSDDPSWPPRFSKVRLFFDDGGELVMTSARRFARIRLRASPRDEPPLLGLGFDPLHGLPSANEFMNLVRRRKATIKGLLLDQGFAAGVGNWIADEVLFQAGVDPRRLANELSADEIERIREKLNYVVQHAVAVDANKAAFPRSWLFHARWGRAKNAKTHEGQSIEHLTVAGRTTAFVPAVQR